MAGGSETDATIRCPLCGHPNLAGTDRCEGCMASLRQEDVPRPDRGLQRRLMEHEVGDLEMEAPLVLGPEAPVTLAVSKILEVGASAVLVCEEGKLAGIVTERDLLLQWKPEDTGTEGTTLRSIMTVDVETIAPSDKVVVALNRMAVGEYRHIPVLDDGEPTGVLTVANVFAYISRMVG